MLLLRWGVVAGMAVVGVVGVMGVVLGGGGAAAAGAAGESSPVAGAVGEPSPVAGTAGEPVPLPAAPPEADLAYHGEVSLSGERVRVRFAPQNHGPADVFDATVRLRWSVPLADGQRLPRGCVRGGEREVLCDTGELAAGSRGEPVELGVRLAGRVPEVRVRVDTVWNGGASDVNPANQEHEVLVLDSGDAYYF
ncbi:hypothetical protein [Streptomyces sp. NPDC059009]|uniref:hypothetical protein n=1 Tax=Streptomyces sp. NPDC059009 TaxID=3346694 RepID=UPI0036BF42A4